MPSRKTVITTAGVVAALVIIGIITIILSHRDSGTSTLQPILGPLELPKAPHWDASRQCMFFVNLYQGEIHKFVPSTNTHTFVKVGDQPIAFVIPITGTDNEFIISFGPDLALVTWDGKSKKVDSFKIWKHIGDENTYRANEGKVSPSGSLFVAGHSPFKSDNSGQIEMNKAALYVFYKNGQSKIVLPSVTVANGMAWSKDRSKFYFIDSLAYTVTAYSYDIVHDTLTNGTELINFQKAKIPGVPDGMAIDNEDKLWITSFEGHQVIRLDPETRSVMQTINLDAYQVSSAIFAGPSLNDFYLTTGRYKMTADMLKDYPHSGYIFEQNNFNITGRPSMSFPTID